MKTLLLIAAVSLAACGGPSAVTPNLDGGVVLPPPSSQALQAGTYQSSAPLSSTFESATPVGPSVPTTLVVDWSGAFSMVLPNYDFVRGSIRVNADNTLQLGEGMVLVHLDGTTAPALIVGTKSGNAITGTINGLEPFNVALTTIQTQDFTVPQMAGRYITTSSSTGTWVSISFDSSGAIQGHAYVSSADAQAGNTALAIGGYLGTIAHTDVPVGCQACTATPNSYRIGFSLTEASGVRHASTFGFAYFTAGGLVALTSNPTTGEQFTAVFAKQ